MKLKHPIRSISEPFGKAGLIVATVALVMAMLGGAYAATNGAATRANSSARGSRGPRGPRGARGPHLLRPGIQDSPLIPRADLPAIEAPRRAVVNPSGGSGAKRP